MIKSELYEYQKRNLKFHLSRNRSADWSDMGIGKTIIALAKIDILKKQGVIKSALVICPRSVSPVWESEVKKHSTLSAVALTGSLENKIELLAKNSDIYIISYDSIPGRKKTLGILFQFLLNKCFGIVILDEITHVKNFNAVRTKAVTVLCNKINKVLALSGTPITNSPESVITIYNCVDGGETFGRNYFAARNYYFVNHGYSFPDWHIREEKKEEFKKRLFFNAIRLSKDECLDLPPKIFTERYTELLGVQKDIYRKIANELLYELRLPAGIVKIKNSLVKLTKLSQIANGFIYTNKDVQLFSENPKLELLQQTIAEIPRDNKVIIFVKWTQDVKNIAQLLDKFNIPFAVIQGKTRDRAIPINNFINSDQIKILLSQITVGAYGLNLITANYIIYYSLGFSVIEFLQSQDRIHRVGQTRSCIYISLLCHNSVDEYIYKCLKENISIAQSLLNNISVEQLKENLRGI
jgi:SNF2 family DNA or RNA helicase